MQNSTVRDAIVSGFFSSIGVYPQLREQITRPQLERAEELMRMLGLGGFGDREYRTLSTGQKRRCLLGRALVHDPHTLILDEPTSGLDMTASFDLLARLRELARRGRNLVLVTHHLGDIPPEIERVIVLKDGMIMADGPKASVLTEDVLSETYDTRLRLVEIEGHYFAYPAAG